MKYYVVAVFFTTTLNKENSSIHDSIYQVEKVTEGQARLQGSCRSFKKRRFNNFILYTDSASVPQYDRKYPEQSAFQPPCILLEKDETQSANFLISPFPFQQLEFLRQIIYSLPLCTLHEQLSACVLKEIQCINH
ncbi:MAG: hypothetical protein M0O96_04305 [Desulforhopalus sp.]|nr:hypothetical protein [Desulforhopalus sp.]